jgi:anti-sigma factor RsiW
MTCEETAERLAAHLDGELTTAEVAAVEGHVGTCARCASELASGRRLNALLDRHLATEPAVDLDARFAALWERTGTESRPARVSRGGSSRTRSGVRRALPRVAVGALAAGLALGLWWMGPATEGPTTDRAPSPVQVAKAPKPEAQQVANVAKPAQAKKPAPKAGVAKRKPEADVAVARVDRAAPSEAKRDPVAQVAQRDDELPRELIPRAEMFLDYSIVKRLDELENFDAVMAGGKSADDRRS